MPQASFSKQPLQQKIKEIGNTSAQAQSIQPVQTLQAKESNDKENACFAVAPIQLVNNADSECVTMEEESKDPIAPKHFS